MQHLPDFRPWPRQSLYDLMESLLPAAKGYRWADLSLTSADNPRTPQLAEHLGAVIYKRYRVYRRWLAGVPLNVPVPPAAPAAHPA